MEQNIGNNLSLSHYTHHLFGRYLKIAGVTEIAVNRPQEVWTEINGVWSRQIAHHITTESCQRFAWTLAKFKNDEISAVKPLLSATLESGERVQIVYPPACARNLLSITIRKPSTRQITHQEYIDAGFYRYVSRKEKKQTQDNKLITLYRDNDIPAFIQLAVEIGKNMVFSGGTGSGKTTYMKSLIDFIPLNTRLITIEDAAEIKFDRHENYVQLFYPSEAESDEKSIITAGKLIKSCLRMKPDRILLAEVKGGDAWDFIKVAGSGHGGNMTSIHAKSSKEAITQMITKCYQNTECQNLPYDVLKQIIVDSIDIVAHVGREGTVRYMSDIYFRGVHEDI